MKILELRKRYNNLGYIFIKDFLSKNEVKLIRSEIINSEDDNNDKIYKYYSRSIKSKKLILNRIENLCYNNKKIKNILKKLFNVNFNPFKSSLKEILFFILIKIIVGL